MGTTGRKIRIRSLLVFNEVSSPNCVSLRTVYLLLCFDNNCVMKDL